MRYIWFVMHYVRTSSTGVSSVFFGILVWVEAFFGVTGTVPVGFITGS
jgi:hypothetical protein